MNKVLHNRIKRLRQKEIEHATNVVYTVLFHIESMDELIANLEFHFGKLEEVRAKKYHGKACLHLVNLVSKINEHISKATDRMAEVEASLSVIGIFNILLGDCSSIVKKL